MTVAAKARHNIEWNVMMLCVVSWDATSLQCSLSEHVVFRQRVRDSLNAINCAHHHHHIQITVRQIIIMKPQCALRKMQPKTHCNFCFYVLRVSRFYLCDQRRWHNTCASCVCDEIWDFLFCPNVCEQHVVRPMRERCHDDHTCAQVCRRRMSNCTKRCVRTI